MLEVNQISKSFFRKEALQDVSFKVNTGEIYGVLGPNGVGKTTLIRVINRIVAPDSGHIRFEGVLMTEKHLEHIGYLPEERGMYKNMTVQDHAMFLGRLRGLSNTDAKQKVDYWFDKFSINDWRKKRIEELSKGMAQKVQFICAVLHEPKLLILDEPFSGFDPVNAEIIKNELLQMKHNGKTILLSTHNMKSVEEICDKAILINESRKVAEGTISELQSSIKTGLYSVKFRGNMIAFVNALWTGFEVIDKDILGDNRFRVIVKMRGDKKFDDLLRVLIGQVEIEGAEEIIPSMQDVFVDIVSNKKMVEDEE
ncbi:MAG: ABC transporter ATP-binding protein [Crocinitomicaceae bacterium]